MIAELEFVGETEAMNGLSQFDVSDSKWKGVVLGRLEYIRDQCDRIELVAAERYIQKRIEQFKRSATPSELQHEARTLRDLIRTELWERRFIYIPVPKAKLLIDIDKDWAGVWGNFPKAEADSREAVYCYSLDRNTACVFHSMLVLENGLKPLAKVLQIPYTNKTWHTVIEKAEKEIEKLISSKAKRSKARNELLTFYSSAAKEFTYFREAWRNHTAHGRVHYDAGDALKVLSHVHDFMTHIAKRLKG